MRRYLTLVFLLCLAIPAGVSISGCYPQSGRQLLQRPGLWAEDTDVYSIDLEPQNHWYFDGIRADPPDCALRRPRPARARPPACLSYSYGTTNNRLVDISPTGNICAGTWNRNSGGGIADYTICNVPNPMPSTGGLPLRLGVHYQPLRTRSRRTRCRSMFTPRSVPSHLALPAVRASSSAIRRAPSRSSTPRPVIASDGNAIRALRPCHCDQLFVPGRPAAGRDLGSRLARSAIGALPTPSAPPRWPPSMRTPTRSPPSCPAPR